MRLINFALDFFFISRLEFVSLTANENEKVKYDKLVNMYYVELRLRSYRTLVAIKTL